MKLGLHKTARGIFNICIRSRIRLIDTDDWQITEENFLFLDGRWGPIGLIVLPIRLKFTE